MCRLQPSLESTAGSCQYRIEFFRDVMGQASARVSASTALPLQCQRSLEPFLYAVEIEQTLGLIRSEQEESGLLPEVEPLLVPDNGMVRPLDLLEDELILAIPAVPVRADSLPVSERFGVAELEEEEAPANPFGSLAALRKSAD